ncbi:MAG: flavin reductase family protein [Syntrophales bacterium]|nr:flavin reductase family protein [Syntrophales bacterium]
MKKSFGPRTLVYPVPVWAVGTYDKEVRPDVAAVAWGGVCCSIPPCVTISLRKATLTYANIMERKAFSINVPSAGLFKEVDYFGLVSGREQDKLCRAGLKAVRCRIADAPYIDEFPLVLECRLLQALEIGLHTAFIGEILDVLADEDVIGEQGFPEMNKIKPVLYSPELHDYYETGALLGKAFQSGKDILQK